MRKPGKHIPENRLLPAGKTCSDCVHWQAFCKHVISSLKGNETWCDWSPSRFQALTVVPADPTPTHLGEGI